MARLLDLERDDAAKSLTRDAQNGRFLPSKTETKDNPDTVSNPSNPALFGEDLETAAWTVLGMSGSGMISDKIAGPVIKQIVPWDKEPMGKAFDAVATFIGAWLAGKAVGIVDDRIGRLIMRGGIYLGVAKGLSIPIKGFSLTASYPNVPWFPEFGPKGAQPGAMPELPAASAPAASGILPALGIGSTGF